jgi:outer membrane lipoprotein
MCAMNRSAAFFLARSALCASLLVLAACSPAPIYKPSPATVAVAPNMVAQSPQQYGNADVIWGGRIVEVYNLADHSEIEIAAYPLDGSQRPKIDNSPGWGRFIAVVPGYVESFDYPNGGLITLVGRLNGTRPGAVGQAPYVFPLVSVTQSHVWTAAELQSGHPNISFGIGVGVSNYHY